MKDWIKQKLDLIDELFPKERLEKSKKRYESIWNGNGKCDKLPFVYYPFLFNYYDDFNSFENPDERLRLLLDECILHGRLGDDFIPSLFPGCRQSTIPSMFGAREIVAGNDFTCERLIDEMEEVETLTEPEIGKDTVAYQWLELEKYYLQETEGRIPVHVCDMQGPVDVGAQLCGYDNLFIMAQIEPQYYKKLVGGATKAFINLWNSQKAMLGRNFVGTHLYGWNWVPENIGTTLSADSIVMVSPGFFEEYYKPFLMEIGENLGGLVIHSCGKFAHIMPILKSIPYLKGINASQMTLKELVEAGLDSTLTTVCYLEYEQVDEMLELIKNHSLKADLTLNSIPFEPERAKHPELWSAKDWDALKERNEILQEKFSQIWTSK